MKMMQLLKNTGLLLVTQEELDGYYRRLSRRRRRGEWVGLSTDLRYPVNDSFQDVLDTARVDLEKLLLPRQGGLRVISSCWDTRPTNHIGYSIAEGDAAGTSELTYLLRTLYGRIPAAGASVQPACILTDRSDLSWQGCNLFLVGGPVSNLAVREVMDLLDFTYFFEGNSLKNRNKPEEVRECPLAQAREDVTEDYGMAIRCPSPFARDRMVWVFAGCQTFGTLAAVDAFSNVDFVEGLNKEVGSDGFQIVVRGQWDPANKRPPWPVSVELVAGPEPVTLRDGAPSLI